MGVLISKLYSLFGQEEHKLIVVGLDNAGKTTILYQFHMSEVVVTTPTIGSNVEEISYKNLKFVMWDIGGQESLRTSWGTYYTGAKALILVVDSTDVERLDLVKRELFQMMAHEDLQKAHVLIFANKQDLKGALSAADISTRLNLKDIKGHSWTIQPCCALTGEGLSQGMDWIASQITSKR